MVDELFREQLVAIKLDEVLNIATTLTYSYYDRSFGTLSFTRLSKLFAFQKKLLKFVKDHDERITKYKTILSSLILF